MGNNCIHSAKQNKNERILLCRIVNLLPTNYNISTMPKRIILIRHGETDYNSKNIVQGHLDTFLNKQGLTQAVTVSEKLINYDIDIIFSSDLKRAAHTAQVIAGKLNKKIITTKLLREHAYGKFQGLTGKEINKLLPDFKFEHSHMKYLDNESICGRYGVESNQKLHKRLSQFMKNLKKYKDKTVLLVLHGGTIWAFLRIFSLEKAFEKQEKISNASISILEKAENGYQLAVFNQ